MRSVVLAVVARAYGVRVPEILSRSRAGRLPAARHLSAYIMRELFCTTTSSGGRIRAGKASYLALAEVFHRDHSTIMYGVRRVAARMETDPTYRALVEELLSKSRDSVAEKLRKALPNGCT